MNDYLVTGLAHIGIMTDDAKKCADFYISNLGFHPFYSYQKDGLCLEFVKNGGCIIEFIQGTHTPEAGTVNHVALEVQGIEALTRQLREKGIRFETDEITKMPDLFPNGVKNIFFSGPAGERIELFDYSR